MYIEKSYQSKNSYYPVIEDDFKHYTRALQMRIRKFADSLIDEMRDIIINGKLFYPPHYARVILNDYLEIVN